MENISSFLQRFKNILSSQGARKQISIEVIKKKFNIELDPEKVKIKGDILYITSSPSLKNMLFLKKESLLKEINSQVGSRIVDIL
jgi:hypothetical protein